MHLIVAAGDGIGPEITAATLQVLRATDARFGLGLRLTEVEVGLASVARHGRSVPEGVLEAVRAADGLLLGPASSAEYAHLPSPSAVFRRGLDLYANIRPARTAPGLPGRCGAMDLVMVRENTEGFYADRNMTQGSADLLVTPDVAIAIRKITRAASERIMRAACTLARRRRGHVSIVHKANALAVSDGLFLSVCRDVAAEFPGVLVDDVIVDAMAAHLVRNPARFDVVVTTNMFGDILSDLAAELAGSLGLAASLNAGEAHAMAQAAHGSAPDIAGQDRANPFSLILSAALLLEWHAERRASPAHAGAARAVRQAVDAAIAAHETTADIGGSLGTRATAAALAARL